MEDLLAQGTDKTEHVRFPDSQQHSVRARAGGHGKHPNGSRHWRSAAGRRHGPHGSGRRHEPRHTAAAGGMGPEQLAPMLSMQSATWQWDKNLIFLILNYDVILPHVE